MTNAARAGRVADASQIREKNAISVGHGLVQIAGQGEADFFPFGPRFLREGRIHAHGDDGGVEAGVLAEAGGDVAQLRGADTGEGSGKKQEHRVFLAEIRAQLDIHQTAIGLGFKGEVRRLGTNFNGHKCNLFVSSLPTKYSAKLYNHPGESVKLRFSRIIRTSPRPKHL